MKRANSGQALFMRVIAASGARRGALIGAFYRRRAVWPTSNGFAALTRSTYGQPYRITTFLPDWTPCGHSEFATLRDAAQAGKSFGFRGVLHGE